MDRRSGYSTEATCQSQFDLLPPGPGSPTMPSKVRPRAQGDTHKFESHIRGAKSFDCNSACGLCSPVLMLAHGCYDGVQGWCLCLAERVRV